MNRRLPVVIAPGFFTGPWPAPLNIAEKLKHKYSVFSPKRSFMSLFSIHAQALALSNLVNKALKESGAEKCNIVGISMGGIVTLYYLHELGGADKVDTFIAVATPFQGAWSSIYGVISLGLFSPSVWELLPTSPLINYLLNKPELTNVNIYSLVGKKDKLAPLNSTTYQYARQKKFPGGHADMCLGLDEDVLEFIETILEAESP